nr:hypothetical protein [Tanacetum cinerariifolium]
MEESLSKFMTESAKRHDENFNFIKEIRASTDVAVKNQRALIKALEIQIGKISKVLQEMGSGSLPSSTETNPGDHVKSISTCEEAEMLSIWRIRSHRYHASNQLKDDMISLMELNRATIPFLGRLREYGNDMEEIKATMNSHYSTILNDTLPPKENDPWSFTLLFYINNMSFIKALTDLGASVNVMPYSTFTNLGLGELVPTKLIVELANRTKKHPKGIAKNVLVGNDKFVFPVDFIVLDMPEDIKVLLILGRPFLPTAHAKIDVFERKIDLRIRNEKIMFKSDNPTSNMVKKRKGVGTQKESQIYYGQFISKIDRKSRVLTNDVLRSLSASIYCRDLDTTLLRDLIDSEGKPILEDPKPGVLRVVISRPPRASMQDLYNMMGRIEIRQEAIERMEFRQSYHWDRYRGVFENMAEVHSVPLQGAYNPHAYAQPQYDQYYQEYPPPPPHYPPHQQQQ